MQLHGTQKPILKTFDTFEQTIMQLAMKACKTKEGGGTRER